MSNSEKTILIVDDDKYICSSLRRILEDSDFQVHEAYSGNRAIEMVHEHGFDLIIMDIKMPDMSGLEALEEIRRINPKQFVIIMTGYGTTETAIEAMKYGAFDYILKPFDDLHLWSLVEKALNLNEGTKKNVDYEKETSEGKEREYIIGHSRKMLEVIKLIGQAAKEDGIVLIRGESGTGKELIAHTISHNSGKEIVSLSLPPLRERKEDIPELVNFFISQNNSERDKKITGIDPQLLNKFMHYSWPGNVRELKSIIKKSFTSSDGDILILEEFPPVMEEGKEEENLPVEKETIDEGLNELIDKIFQKVMDLPEDEHLGAISLLEKEFVIKALQASGGSKMKAAEMLGMRLNTISKKIRDYGIEIS